MSGEGDLEGAGVGDGLLEHGPSWIGYGEPRVHPERRDPGQPWVGEHLLDRWAVSPAHERGHRVSRLGEEHSAGVVGGRLVGLPRLVVATSRETLLALPAGLGAALHVTLTDLGSHDPFAVDDRHRETALADEEDAPGQGCACGSRHVGRVRCPVVLPGEGEGGLGGGAVIGGEAEAATADAEGHRTVPGAEVLAPSDQPLGRDRHGARWHR